MTEVKVNPAKTKVIIEEEETISLLNLTKKQAAVIAALLGTRNTANDTNNITNGDNTDGIFHKLKTAIHPLNFKVNRSNEFANEVVVY